MTDKIRLYSAKFKAWGAVKEYYRDFASKKARDNFVKNTPYSDKAKSYLTNDLQKVYNALSVGELIAKYEYDNKRQEYVLKLYDFGGFYKANTAPLIYMQVFNNHTIKYYLPLNLNTQIYKQIQPIIFVNETRYNETMPTSNTMYNKIKAGKNIFNRRIKELQKKYGLIESVVTCYY